MSIHKAKAWYFPQQRFTFGITAKVNPGQGFCPRLKEVPAGNRQPWWRMGVRSRAWERGSRPWRADPQAEWVVGQKAGGQWGRAQRQRHRKTLPGFIWGLGWVEHLARGSQRGGVQNGASRQLIIQSSYKQLLSF